tara:strand:- start:573 stop:740 length:168 start_codon:yes stop_codon:yes gene_type:complete
VGFWWSRDVDFEFLSIFTLDIEEERTIDLYDSDDETIVVKQEPVTEEPFIKLDEF